MRIGYFIAFLIVFAAISCSESGNTNLQEKRVVSDSVLSTESSATHPLITNIDSLQILYYDDPHGDSSRYSRNFTFTSTEDPVVINELILNTSSPGSTLDSLRDCRSEGKIYAFGETGSVRTIYFSTREDACTYLYIIKEGRFIYYALNQNLGNKLRSLRALSKAP